MKTLHLMIMVAIGLSCAACDESIRQPGEAGGECRIGSDPCAEELVCRDGVCQAAMETEAADEIQLEFTIADRHLPADGESETVLLIQAKLEESNEPFDGELLLYPTPYGAGRMEPGRIEFNNGIAQAVYVSCRANDPVGCPEFVRISAARPESPRLPIGSSLPIQLFDPAATFESSINETSCAAGEGKLALRPNLSLAEEELGTFAASGIDIDSESGVLSLTSSGHQIDIRFASANAQAGQYPLNTTDVSVALDPNTENVPSQCADTASGEWSGTLKVLSANLNEAGLQSLSFFFELTCVSNAGQGVSLRACGHYVSTQ